MKNINNIIKSELIVRTNNVNFKQEFGKVGDADNIANEGNSTIFTTKFDIKKVIFVTVNGLTLIPGKHFDVTGLRTISISNEGSAVKANPGLITEISVGYHFANNRAIDNAIKLPPVINTFYIDKYSGRDGSITFNFDIIQNDGANVYWSILKDGNQDPIFSGNGLTSVNGISINSNGTLVNLTTYISEAEYVERHGEAIPFTFVVVYDLSNDGTHLDEKLLDSVEYELLPPPNITGSLIATPEIINTTASTTVIVSYDITVAESSVQDFGWKVIKQVGLTSEVTIAQGTHTSVLSGEVREDFTLAPGTFNTIKYKLEIEDNIAEDTTVVANDTVVVDVPSGELFASAGYLSADIMNYPNPQDPLQYITIGSTGTSQDIVEYNTRVPREIFTKSISKDYLVTQEFINATVNTFEGTVTSVYFVMEIPDAWGPIKFAQSLGELSQTSFNKVYLSNGYTAYLYKFAPSSAYRPADYFIKPA
jgi:hypothetical protein